MDAVGPLLARGRAADVFALGPRTVLRRYRTPHDVLQEAAVMHHVREHDFPAPAVLQASGGDLVMERLEGPTMLSDLLRGPWRVARHAATLGALHRALGRIPAPGWLPAIDDGEVVCHLDLHPDNVLLTPGGPVVIDWTNARRGPVGADTATTWLLLSVAKPPGGPALRTGAALLRRAFVREFLRHVDVEQARVALRRVGQLRLADPNMRPEERIAIARFVAAEAQ